MLALLWPVIPLASTSFGWHFYAPSQETAIARRAPSFAEMWGSNGQGPWVIRLTEDTPANREDILQALQAVKGHDYRGHVKRWEPVKYSALELAQARVVAAGGKGVNGVGQLWRENWVTADLELPHHVPAAQERLRRAGIPLDAVHFRAVPPREVAPRTTWDASFRAWLEAPEQVGGRTPLTFILWFENTGQQDLEFVFEPGRCGTLVWQVVNESGEVVRPQPAGGTCTTNSIGPTRVAAGKRVALVDPQQDSRREVSWDLRDPFGKRVPAGRYTLQASFPTGFGGNVEQVRLPDVSFEVRR
ncbi:hypothetical protein [Deinococcus sp. Marseille-Q6407]|uniref:hypothetical protein n=1 Tax=Deinococcus sp. Marseille-Q6407 TaxID=2969223 RepID=UPI0021C09307|nr:hypothetical protein [Deinococcus sp. Marseille-Q6407]